MMRRIHDRVGGLDVHRDSVVACAELFDGTTVQVDKATFSTTATGVRELGEWLAEREVQLVVMEATGVYWRPIYYGLEDRFGELWLVNAHHVKNVPGRKTDMSDAEWLADVAAHGMVRASFVAPPDIRGLRELTRYRKTQIRARGQEIQRLEKLLQDAGVKLTSVVSKVWSQSSRAMVEMLISGETNPAVLAELAKGRMRSKIPALVEVLESRWVAHHATVARQILAHIDFLDDTIATLTAEIVERVAPFEVAVDLLKTIPGISDLTAQTMIAEMGIDMSRFPTPTTSPHRPESRPRPMSPPANGDRPEHVTAAATSARPSSRPHAPRHAPRERFCRPATTGSPIAEDQTRQPSRSRIRSWSQPITCSPPARPTTISAPTSTTDAPTPTARPDTTSPNSKRPATQSQSPQQPDNPDTQTLRGYAPTPTSRARIHAGTNAFHPR